MTRPFSRHSFYGKSSIDKALRPSADIGAKFTPINTEAQGSLSSF